MDYLKSALFLFAIISIDASVNGQCSCGPSQGELSPVVLTAQSCGSSSSVPSSPPSVPSLPPSSQSWGPSSGGSSSGSQQPWGPSSGSQQPCAPSQSSSSGSSQGNYIPGLSPGGSNWPSSVPSIPIAPPSSQPWGPSSGGSSSGSQQPWGPSSGSQQPWGPSSGSQQPWGPSSGSQQPGSSQGSSPSDYYYPSVPTTQKPKVFVHKQPPIVVNRPGKSYTIPAGQPIVIKPAPVVIQRPGGNERVPIAVTVTGKPIIINKKIVKIERPIVKKYYVESHSEQEPNNEGPVDDNQPLPPVDRCASANSGSAQSSNAQSSNAQSSNAQSSNAQSPLQSAPVAQSPIQAIPLVPSSNPLPSNVAGLFASSPVSGSQSAGLASGTNAYAQPSVTGARPGEGTDGIQRLLSAASSALSGSQSAGGSCQAGGSGQSVWGSIVNVAQAVLGTSGGVNGRPSTSGGLLSNILGSPSPATIGNGQLTSLLGVIPTAFPGPLSLSEESTTTEPPFDPATIIGSPYPGLGDDYSGPTSQALSHQSGVPQAYQSQSAPCQSGQSQSSPARPNTQTSVSYSAAPQEQQQQQQKPQSPCGPSYPSPVPVQPVPWAPLPSSSAPCSC